MRRALVFLLAAALLMFGQSAGATIFGTVRGIVHDPQHRPVDGAKVQLKSATSDWSQITQTNQDGEFTFTAVPLGDYAVTITISGFEKSQESMTVASNSSPVLHFMLSLAAVNQTATVSAQAQVANPDSVTPTTLLDREDIVQTPGADRTNGLQMITDYVPGSYFTHDQLHIRGGHQVSWLIDGVPIPNTNIASNLGPQIDPKDIDYLEVQRGSYDAGYGDRTYGVFNIVPRSGFERNNEAELVTSFGNWYQTNDQLNFGSHTERFAYFASVNGNRSNLGLQTPIGQVFHDTENGFGGFGSLMFNLDSKDQFRLVTSLRRDYYQIPYDPNPNDPDNQSVPSNGLRDGEHEADAVVAFSWVRTINTNTLLTVSPFYHYNSANYDGAPNDTPVSTTDHRASSYAGLQATLGAHVAKNDIEAGLYGFGQHDSQLFGAIFNPPNQCPPPTESDPQGGVCVPIHELEPVSGGLVAGFVQDKFKVTSWLTLIAGIRPTHFSGPVSEDTVSPRFGVTLQIPRLNWVFRAFYGHYYQAPPLVSISGPLVDFEGAFSGVPTQFVALHGERDEEHQFGVTIPFRGWALDADNFETRANNFFDHNNVGESNIFIPVTIQGALIQGWELTLRSPRMWNRGRVHLAYSNQLAQARGPLTGGLICFPPTSPLCEPPPGYGPLDHDQRNTLNVGFDANLPWQTYASTNVYYGSGFTNGSPDAQFPGNYLPQHTTFDISFGKSFGEKYTVALAALNVANRHLLIDNSLTFGGFHYNDPREIYVEFRYRFHY
ncbi:MAG TPA: TonB-dependent receptor [Candidatus Acidoferrales bacterium]|nr:TonB-dependent receptor [Candidatus Acidoferrales bacterium]